MSIDISGWDKIAFKDLIVENKKSSLKVSDASNFGNYNFYTSGESILKHHQPLVDGENIYLATGGVANIKYENGNAAYSTDTYSIKTKEDKDTKYLYYYVLNYLKYINDNFFQGSGLKHLQKKDLKQFLVNIPNDLNEQNKIAEILTKVDEAIENTEQLIQKYEQVKVGLMQDLLTKGIDENGNIRSEETHQFKDSPLGRIPVEWDIVELNSFYASPIRDFGSFSSTKLIEFLDSGVPFIKSEMVERFYLNWNAVTYISEDVHKLLNKSYVKKGNILFSKIGSALGKAVVYDEDYELCNSNAAVAKIDINKKLASNDFITFYLNSVYAQRQFEEMIVSLLPRINLKDINRLLVPKISLYEQNTIVSMLKSILNKNKENKKLLDKLKKQKQGLMQDLLAGKVRVNY